MPNKRVKKYNSDFSSSDEEDIKPKKLKNEKLPEQTKIKSDNIPEKEIDDEGNEYFSLGRGRRIYSSFFKGKRYINIREYYEDKKSGKMKPGNKGITLNALEWNNLKAVADQFHLALEQ
ncbi:putative RNA polymerase II transcriptional coactivator [Chironomus tepperi]|uniref:putative RNA polymerase II transcriptional coactivator n=1 Tax=Chironomus tepperi TaxID=113505 RepID=UPI00391F505A